jgi:catechol 2,3-dioxygenase-like lactoylglutathione lyase family enzyme|tara:strand:+ start:218 stop:625 length:408 start_codon:yes stop_codon:yes gene_type:complete
MLEIEKLDHVGIRVSDKDVSLAFYKSLGFEMIEDNGFDTGHPIVLRHAASGDVLNLLGPAATSAKNILMDVPEKHAGITHVSYRVKSIEAARTFLESIDVPISGEIDTGHFQGLFIRDPDRNVIELDGHATARSS